MLAKSWKVYHWNAEKLLPKFLDIDINADDIFYFSFFTVIVNIGQEKGGKSTSISVQFGRNFLPIIRY